jgi:hypothetical protein
MSARNLKRIVLNPLKFFGNTKIVVIISLSQFMNGNVSPIPLIQESEVKIEKKDEKE